MSGAEIIAACLANEAASRAKAMPPQVYAGLVDLYRAAFVQGQIDPEQILIQTAKVWGVKVSDVKSRTRRQPVVFARQMAIYLLRKYRFESDTQTAVWMLRDHATVWHSIKKVLADAETNKAYKAKLNVLQKIFDACRASEK